jgi:hypothetical protein
MLPHPSTLINPKGFISAVALTLARGGSHRSMSRELRPGSSLAALMASMSVEDLTKYRHDEPFFGITQKGKGPSISILSELSTSCTTLLLAWRLHRIGASALILN